MLILIVVGQFLICVVLPSERPGLFRKDRDPVAHGIRLPVQIREHIPDRLRITVHQHEQRSPRIIMTGIQKISGLLQSLPQRFREIGRAHGRSCLPCGRGFPLIVLSPADLLIVCFIKLQDLAKTISVHIIILSGIS